MSNTKLKHIPSDDVETMINKTQTVWILRELPKMTQIWGLVSNHI
jgi:hypothetical protein